MAHRLIEEIESLLSGVRLPYTSASRGDDVYEGYVFSLVVATALERGAGVHYVTSTGIRTNDLLFRAGPGHLYTTDREFTHAVIKFERTPTLEAHVGVRVSGTSGVLHECDVLVLPAEEARISRANGVAPRGSRCLLAIECKYYVATRLDLGLARNFEGLQADLKSKGAIFVANLDSHSVRKYLGSRRREYEHNVSPGTYEADALRQTVRRAFRGYVSEFSPSTRV
jgi:hypothetical protein